MQESAIIPVPRISVAVRLATMDDFGFIDRLQTAHAKQLGYMPRAQPRQTLAAGVALEPRKPVQRRPHVQTGLPPAHPVPDQPQPTPATVKAPRPKRKADPKLIAAARELRDRWLEKVNEDPSLILPAGKYDVARELPDQADGRHAVPRLAVVEVKALPEAA